MPILYGAVAYREDCIPDFENEIASWYLAKTGAQISHQSPALIEEQRQEK